MVGRVGIKKDISDLNNISCFGPEQALVQGGLMWVQGGENAESPVACSGAGNNTTIQVSNYVSNDLNLNSSQTSQITLERKGVEEVGGVDGGGRKT